MRLTDIVSNVDLSLFPIVGLVLFLIAFAVILAGVVRTGRQRASSYASIVFDDDAQHAGSANAPKGGAQ